ncbi:MAG: adenine phosphoribosyltransferase [Ignavibacteriota bacterium]|nr:MAG: adenine phosphoribosyltransferase [Chlorobiota bacterium]MBE7477901.1 adenine phosphoribosyltransferase [Ignavibacteriales bacterium]MBL1123569.1 adenine phosphoribosyltransferase [Ignavibacteriota bacterium]MCE7857007.1 adenine phosphoribosyltransferase [Ignavibacteria bacterium CHB3]MCL4278412.1 adenine phosphoribosyltransferase [Ignavibacteriaceae bacterium]MEB2296698.1 adenine phosphoribosyltransferase [Ignavibacteria bacterium]
MSSDLKKYIRSIRDFPIKGIMFRDITTLLKNPTAVKDTLSQLLSSLKGLNIDKVVAIESRGFIFGALLANELNAGFVPIRKPGKLPAEKESQTYQLEYGLDKIEIHKDAINKSDKVLVHDDLLATGGTAEAACELVEKLGGEVVQISFIVELSFLNGREKLRKYNVNSLIIYEDEN